MAWITSVIDDYDMKKAKKKAKLADKKAAKVKAKKKADKAKKKASSGAMSKIDKLEAEIVSLKKKNDDLKAIIKSNEAIVKASNEEGLLSVAEQLAVIALYKARND